MNITPPQQPAIGFKQVAFVKGRMYSVFNEEVEYVLGTTYRQELNDCNQGGFYVASSVIEAFHASFPICGDNSKTPLRAVLRVECSGNSRQYPNKRAYNTIKPLQVVGYMSILDHFWIDPVRDMCERRYGVFPYQPNKFIHSILAELKGRGMPLTKQYQALPKKEQSNTEMWREFNRLRSIAGQHKLNIMEEPGTGLSMPVVDIPFRDNP
jgi:hypothetical protein